MPPITGTVVGQGGGIEALLRINRVVAERLGAPTLLSFRAQRGIFLPVAAGRLRLP
jgi:hypothetical protein